MEFSQVIKKKFILIIFRVEKEHLENVGSFRVVQDMRLPYDDIVFGESTEEVSFFCFNLRLF